MNDEEKDYDVDQLKRVIDELEIEPEDVRLVQELEAKRRAEEEKRLKDTKAEGEEEGYAKGYAKGFEKGFEGGHSAGYEQGHKEGLLKAAQEDNQ